MPKFHCALVIPLVSYSSGAMPYFFRAVLVQDPVEALS